MCGKVKLDKNKLNWFNYSTTNGLMIKPTSPIPVMYRNRATEILNFGWSNFYNLQLEKLNTSEHRVIIPATSFFEGQQEYEIPDHDYLMGIKRNHDRCIILTVSSKVLGRAPVIVGHNEFFQNQKSVDYVADRSS